LMAREHELSGKVVLITGAAGVIGASTARLFARHGARVVLTGRDEARLRVVPLDPEGAAQAAHLVLDVTDPTAWTKVVEHIEREMGGVDVLVNNAGITEPGRVEDLSAEQVERVVAVNLGGVVHGCRAVLPAMRARRSGRIVNVGSLGGIMPVPCEAIYCATKYAIRGFTFALREELRGSGVDVSVVSCDSVATPMLDQSAQHEGAWMSFVDKPLDPEIVAQAIVRAATGRKSEVLVPMGAGLSARLAMALPGLVFLVMPVLRWMGLRGLARWRRRVAALDGRSGPKDSWP
jgi:uncharacterized protein